MAIQIALLHQQVAEDHVIDIAAEVRGGLRALPLAGRVRPGMRIAIGLGSRGIACLVDVVRPLIEELRAIGAEPFFVPAMGSHGSSTAEGQKEVLESYGIRGDTFDVPILSSLAVLQVGTTPAGMPVFCDAHAAGADGIIVVNRIKEHTAFKARWESGLLKILAVGLGKARGAAEIHNWGVPEAMPAAARVLIANLPVIGGVGIVENGRHEPARIAVLPAEGIEAAEPALLDEARRLLPRIPFESLDLLVLQEIGKDISGTGMDLNVVGMWRRTGGPVSPRFKVVAALDLTANSHGNAIGMGHADLITRRLLKKVDRTATDRNCLTSKNYAGGKIPITLETDEALFATALAGVPNEAVRFVIVNNTLELENLWVSECLLVEAAKNPALRPIGPISPLKFDRWGALRLPAFGFGAYD
jgi:hypothetical protein